ncbi:Holliday junction resolvase RecU [Shouchella clausii]|uniref:Holliday junction resolvase RecU n=1 Tax=Shouchella clausii TaxID=79880 RepID=UPI000BA7B55E|nr:Holliday junction resolvase RecU [Shouchella clausii]PAE96754.1 hypothetical protein CHH71_12145 [Shouchella clausii]
MSHSQAIGNSFEYLIDLVNSQYNAKRIAVINKRPTPMKIVKRLGIKRGTENFVAIFDKKSTVDYDGVYAGKAIAFEAKTILNLQRFDLKRIQPHQLEHLKRTEEQGGVAFFLIEFQSTRTTYYVPLSMINKYVADMERGGRKSISLDDFAVYAYEVRRGRVPLDYLAVVDKLLERGQVG